MSLNFQTIQPGGSLSRTLPSQPQGTPQSYQSLAQKLGNDITLDYLNLDRASVRAGLGEQLGKLKDRLQPEVVEQLRQSPVGSRFLQALDNAAAGKISEGDVADIQGLIVGAGIDIHTDYDSDGVDGTYNAATHRGLSELSERLRTGPDQVLGNLQQRQSAAQNYVDQTRRHLAFEADPATLSFPDRSEPTRPGQPIELARATKNDAAADKTAGYSVDYGSPEAAQRGKNLATRANKIASAHSESTGNCYKAVKRAISKEIALTGKSAYMAADQLARSPKFREVTGLAPGDLRTLPPGAVVVWGKTKESPDGHVSIALGNGREASDYRGSQMTSLRGHTNFRVFLPN